MTTAVPPPGVWHPAYGDYDELREWLDGRGPYEGRDTIKVSRSTRTAVLMVKPDEMYSQDPPPEPFLLTRRRCWGPAPYVGDPFHYQWWSAADQLGRAIAGPSQIVYQQR